MKKLILAFFYIAIAILTHAQETLSPPPSPPPAPVATAKFVYDANGYRIQRYIDDPWALVKHNTPLTNGLSNAEKDSVFIKSLDSTSVAKKEEALKTALQYGVNLYPNPTTKTFVFYTNKPTDGKPMQLDVYDNYGKHISTKTHDGNQTEISLEGVADGTYHVMVLLPDGDKLYYRIIKANN